MSARFIGLIYFYLISAASLALIVVGIFNIVNFGINSTQYDKYPLRYQPNDCESIYQNKGYPANYDMPLPAPGATPSAAELQRVQAACEKQLDLQRKQQKLDDIKSAVTFSLVGLVLFLIHFPQARKQSS